MFAFLTALPVIGKIIDSIGGVWLKSRAQDIEKQGSHEQRVENVVAKEIDLERREAELNAETRNIEAQGNWWQRSVRPAAAWVVIIFIAKVLLYDKAFGQWTGGHTDSLDVNLWWVVQTIIISYFGGRSAEKVADKIAGIWKTK